MGDLTVIEGPQEGIVDEELAFTVTWTGAATLATPLTKLYLNNALSTGALSGSEASAGIVQTLRIFTVPSGWGGKEPVLEAECTVDGSNRIVKIPIVCVKRG